MNPNPHVLVAEDDIPLANFLRRQLESEAYNVQLVQDGEAASEKVNSDKYHLLILDLNLPGIDGLAILKSRKSTRSWQRVICKAPRKKQPQRQSSPSRRSRKITDLPSTWLHPRLRQ